MKNFKYKWNGLRIASTIMHLMDMNRGLLLWEMGESIWDACWGLPWKLIIGELWTGPTSIYCYSMQISARLAMQEEILHVICTFTLPRKGKISFWRDPYTEFVGCKVRKVFFIAQFHWSAIKNWWCCWLASVGITESGFQVIASVSSHPSRRIQKPRKKVEAPKTPYIFGYNLLNFLVMFRKYSPKVSETIWG